MMDIFDFETMSAAERDSLALRLRIAQLAVSVLLLIVAITRLIMNS